MKNYFFTRIAPSPESMNHKVFQPIVSSCARSNIGFPSSFNIWGIALVILLEDFYSKRLMHIVQISALQNFKPTTMVTISRCKLNSITSTKTFCRTKVCSHRSKNEKFHHRRNPHWWQFEESTPTSNFINTIPSLFFVASTSGFTVSEGFFFNFLLLLYNIAKLLIVIFSSSYFYY